MPATQLWPAVGTTSGVRELRHPALGVWSFAILAQVLHLTTPLAVTSAVPGLAVTALALLFWFAWRVVPAPQREVWLWTAALASVNLVATVYTRKIWVPSLLPLFCVVLLIAWSYRHTRVGALVWGIDGALVGQIHMTGFFLAAAVLLGTAALTRTPVRWRAWLVGSAWGAIPALPWLHYLWTELPTLRAHFSTLPGTAFDLAFFRTAFEIALGQTAALNLGSHFQEYLAYPVLLDLPTYGVQAARVVLYAIGALAVVVGTAVALRHGGALARRRSSDTALTLVIAAVTGVLASLAGIPDRPHYHLMLFPLEYLWLPMVVLACFPKPRLWLGAVWVASAMSTFGFLQLIHAHCGAPGGDYGIAYRCQEEAAVEPSHAGGGPRRRSPALQALIRPGREELFARMLGRGEELPGSCRLTAGQIDYHVARGRYACADGGVTLHLAHRSNAPDDAPRTRSFAVVVEAGAPPAGLLAAIVERVRRSEGGFAWVLEAGPVTPAATGPSGSRPAGTSPPALSPRQILLRLLAGAAVLLLAFPWWGAPERRRTAAPAIPR